MTASLQYSEFGYPDAHGSHMHYHILPHLMTLASPTIPGMRVLNLGCGNGVLCGEFLKLGCQVVGIDLSLEGIALARKSYPEGRFELMGANESILERLQEPPFDLVVSAEVVEHVYAPRSWAKGTFNAVKPGGRLICSTPYHEYFKNLLISILGKWDPTRIRSEMEVTSNSVAENRCPRCLSKRDFPSAGFAAQDAYRICG